MLQDQIHESSNILDRLLMTYLGYMYTRYWSIYTVLTYLPCVDDLFRIYVYPVLAYLHCLDLFTLC